ncbi:hypothetical protein [Peredibacter starrii]|uniref:DUF2147 domain-containing protein n=1 Tax=Peredibacter starrii TaxID=28202 RepID=A0AAX4HJZ1_9BACT|nr:hypothetical protein [Peredibacter starrii]WPU63512.1 hypothetical protein SOO65_12515 [Peredibacter starrii]
MFRKLIFIQLLGLFSLNVSAACVHLQKLYGVLNTETKAWTTHLIDAPQKYCSKIPEPSKPNLEIIVKKNKQSYKTRIFSPLNEYWDHPEKNGSWSGGKRPSELVEVNAFIPNWHKGSKLIIKEISSGKIMKEVKL